MATCKFTICSQKGVAPLQDGQPEQQLQSNLGQRQAGGDQEEQPESFQSQDMQQQVIAIPSQCYDVIFQGDNVEKMYMSVICESTIKTHHFTILIRMLSRSGDPALQHMILQEWELAVMKLMVPKYLRI